MRIYRRGRVWWIDVTVNGKRVKQSTKCSDRTAAEAVGRRLERELVDPDHATRSRATLGEAVAALLRDRQAEVDAGNRAQATVDFYDRKCGHLNRVLGEHLRLVELTTARVRRYIAQRRKETASDHTISKELGALKLALKIAKLEGNWQGDIEAVVPSLATKYRPRRRWLTPDELERLCDALGVLGNQAACVAFMAATGAELGAALRAERADIDLGAGLVRIRGTKRELRDRVVPVVLPLCRELLEGVLEAAGGEAPLLFRRWWKPQQDIKRAAVSATLEHCSPNDLRRSFAVWHRAEGVSLELLAPAMGHVDTTMLHRVYGRLEPEQLRARMLEQLSPSKPKT